VKNVVGRVYIYAAIKELTSHFTSDASRYGVVQSGATADDRLISLETVLYAWISVSILTSKAPPAGRRRMRTTPRSCHTVDKRYTR